MSHENKNPKFTQNNSNPLKLLAEDLKQFKEVPPMLQKRVNVSTVWRWANRGVKGVKLETVSVGGKKLTSTQAVTRFLERIADR